MKRILYLLVALLFLTSCSILEPEANVEGKSPLSVHFIDVGQADSILIKTKDTTMLIDGGNNSDEDFVVNYLKEQKVDKIDYLIGTHPHADHIGGLDAVVDSFEIGKIIMPKVQTNTKTFESLLKAIKNKGLKITTAKVGLEFALDTDIKCELLSPSKDTYKEINDYSAVLKLTHKNNTFLFMGDAEKLVEKEILARGTELKADVLKLGHHGSRTSSSAEFLKAVDPEYAVITVGKDNSYNHPHKEVLKRIQGIDTYRTDKDGTIIMTSDGKNISVEKEK